MRKYEWPEYPLETFVDPERSICYGIVQPGTPHEDGTPIIRVNNFKEGRIDTREALTIDPEIEKKYQRSRLQGGELIVTLVGSMGLSAIVPDELRGWNVARAVGVVPLQDNVDKRWINFVLRSQPSQNFIHTHANTTVQATFNLRDLARLPIPMPPDRVRIPASQLLSALDDKIDLNHRMNETLEGTARAIFKDWFIDFGPTRTKAEGKEPYLAKEIWNLFPRKLDPSTDTPAGWPSQKLTDFFSIVGGGTPKTSVDEYWNGNIPWFSVVDTPRDGDVFVRSTEKAITLAGIDGSSAKLVPEGTTIISARGTVGNLAIAAQEMAFNQSCYALCANETTGTFFVYLTARDMASRLRAMAHGSVFSTITRQTFEAIEFAKPPKNVVDMFESEAAPLFARIKLNVNENHAIAAARDLLLPKLMSGEIRIKDAVKMVEDVV